MDTHYTPQRPGGSRTGAPLGARQLGLTTSQAAGYLGVSMSTIRRWNNAGYLPSYRTPGGQRRFSRGQLNAFVAGLDDAASEAALPEATAAREATTVIEATTPAAPSAPAAAIAPAARAVASLG